MIIYKCTKCDDELLIRDNTEKSRDVKRTWKKKHHKDNGHGYIRLKAKKEKP